MSNITGVILLMLVVIIFTRTHISPTEKYLNQEPKSNKELIMNSSKAQPNGQHKCI